MAAPERQAGVPTGGAMPIGMRAEAVGWPAVRLTLRDRSTVVPSHAYAAVRDAFLALYGTGPVHVTEGGGARFERDGLRVVDLDTGGTTPPSLLFADRVRDVLRVLVDGEEPADMADLMALPWRFRVDGGRLTRRGDPETGIVSYDVVAEDGEPAGRLRYDGDGRWTAHVAPRPGRDPRAPRTWTSFGLAVGYVGSLLSSSTEGSVPFPPAPSLPVGDFLTRILAQIPRDAVVSARRDGP